MNRPHQMEYNSTKEKLIIPEYGRNVQEMIRYAQSLEDQATKQALIEKVIDLMMQMVPQNRNMDDVREKMWKHVFRIAKYDLDVTPPNGIKPTPEDARKKPQHPGYPVSEPKFRHYGHNVQELVRKAISMDESQIKADFTETIGNYMKMAYKTWNREHYVSDDIIIDDLETLSNGELELDDDAKLDTLTRSNRRKQRHHHSSGSRKDDRRSGGGKRKYRGRRK